MTPEQIASRILTDHFPIKPYEATAQGLIDAMAAGKVTAAKVWEMLCDAAEAAAS